MLTTFANSLDPDQEQQNVGPDLAGSKLLDTLNMNILESLFSKVEFEKKQKTLQKLPKLPSMQRINRVH